MQWAQNLTQRLRGYVPGGTDSSGQGSGATESDNPVTGSSSISIGSLVQQATSCLLIGPDWGLNLELIDVVNRGAESGRNPRHEQVLKHLKKPLTSASPHQQLLALTVLEACTKNCGPGFHQKLAFSDVWAVVQMMATKTGTEREVQNKSLELIEDWAHGLSFPSFRDCYDGLKAKGVVFPPHDVATPNDFAMADPEPLSAAGDALAQHVPEGVSEEDRLAIEAAMAEFASEGQGQPAAAGGQDTGNYVPPSFVEQGQEPPPPPPAAPAPARQPAPYIWRTSRLQSSLSRSWMRC
uniref:Hepatocyte growth factor-regulated tyrosine kinase substrate n=1 Tax=Tetraselmis sp. GSL018 TaxID=582737 RepID=A0A061RQX6_9CHLO